MPVQYLYKNQGSTKQKNTEEYNMKNIIKISIATTLAFACTASFAAAPWSPVQQHRRQELHHTTNKMVHQQEAAQRALYNGNINGALRHASRANALAYKRQDIKHEIHHSNRKWERNHLYCGHGYC
jgi:hypothetical protein